MLLRTTPEALLKLQSIDDVNLKPEVLHGISEESPRNGDVRGRQLAQAAPAALAADQNEFQFQDVVAVALAERISAALESNQVLELVVDQLVAQQ